MKIWEYIFFFSEVREELEDALHTIKEKNQELFKTQQSERQATAAVR